MSEDFRGTCMFIQGHWGLLWQELVTSYCRCWLNKTADLEQWWWWWWWFAVDHSHVPMCSYPRPRHGRRTACLRQRSFLHHWWLHTASHQRDCRHRQPTTRVIIIIIVIVSLSSSFSSSVLLSLSTAGDQMYTRWKCTIIYQAEIAERYLLILLIFVNCIVITVR